MVTGIDIFRKYFAEFAGNYIIIGGTACDIIIDAAGLKPRATKDIDIILIVEALSPEFVTQFWNFIKKGGYGQKERNEDERQYYRFTKPTNEEFPYQIELFSRIPDLLKLEEGMHLTPIPVDEELSSLSAILMNEDYYSFAIGHCTVEDGLQRANIETLVCLKAKAFLEMTERREQGQQVDEKHIRKHKADVFRLCTMLTADTVFDLPESIKADMLVFADKVKNELPDKAIFKEMGLGGINPDTVYGQMIRSFRLNNENK